MSDADQPERAWRHYVKDMIEFSEKFVSDTDGLNRNQFVADIRTYDALNSRVTSVFRVVVAGCRRVKTTAWRSWDRDGVVNDDVVLADHHLLREKAGGFTIS